MLTFLTIIPILSIRLLGVNLILTTHNPYQEKKPINQSINKIESKMNILIFHRNYSTKVEKTQFFSKVNSKDKLDLNNPFIIVKNFLENADKTINLELITSILKNHLSNFELTLEEFKMLITVKPVRFDLAIDEDKAKLKELLPHSKNTTSFSKKDLAKSGAYVFYNKKKRILLCRIIDISK